MLSIVATGLQGAIRGVKNLGKQVRFATSVAINATVKDVQDNAIVRTHAMFKIRTGWLRRGGYGIQARFSNKNQNPMEGRVYVHQGTWWMQQHETGGTRTGAHVPFIVKYPQRGRRRTEGPPIKIQRKGFNVPIYDSIPQGTRRQMIGRAGKGHRFRIGDVFYIRFGPGTRDIMPVSVFKTAVRIKARWGFYADNERKAKEVYPAHFDKAMARAIATAFGKAA